MSDETVFVAQAHFPLSNYVPHPPLYAHCLGLLYHIFHFSPPMLRWVGVVTLLLTAWISYRLAERWARGAGLWTVALLGSHPLLLQGAFLLDIDNTVLTWWVITSIWWLATARWPLRPRACLGFGLWFALGFWMKFTTPWIWLAALWGISVARREWRRAWTTTAVVGGIGFGVFLVALALYCWATGLAWYAFIAPRLLQVIQRGATNPGFAALQELAQRGIRITLWIGPLTLGLWLLGHWQVLRAWKSWTGREGWVGLFVFGWIIFLGYWVIGGLMYSFARYHCPLIPLIAVVGGVTVAQWTRGARLRVGLVIALTVAGIVWQTRVAGDLLYHVNQTLRHALLFSPTQVPGLLRTLAVRFVVLCIGPLILGSCVWLCRARWQLTTRGVASLVVALSAIGHGLGLLGHQATAAYSTSYYYGRPWATAAAVHALVSTYRAKHPDARLMVPFDTLLAEVPAATFDRVFVFEWRLSQRPGQFVEALRDPALGLVIVDPDVSSAYVIRSLWSEPDIQAELARRFVPVPLGGAQGWVRRGDANDLSLRRDE